MPIIIRDTQVKEKHGSISWGDAGVNLTYLTHEKSKEINQLTMDKRGKIDILNTYNVPERVWLTILNCSLSWWGFVDEKGQPATLNEANLRKALNGMAENQINDWFEKCHNLLPKEIGEPANPEHSSGT